MFRSEVAICATIISEARRQSQITPTKAWPKPLTAAAAAAKAPKWKIQMCARRARRR